MLRYNPWTFRPQRRICAQRYLKTSVQIDRPVRAQARIEGTTLWGAISSYDALSVVLPMYRGTLLWDSFSEAVPWKSDPPILQDAQWLTRDA